MWLLQSKLFAKQTIMHASFVRTGLTLFTACLVIHATAQNCRAQAQTLVTLKNGIQLGPGYLKDAATITQNSLQKGSGEAPTAPIIIIDDELRYTYVNRSRIDLGSTGPSTAPPPEVIDLPAKNEVTRVNNSLALVPVGVTMFNRHGRREYTIDSNKGRLTLLQAITRITPLYCQVETLRMGGNSVEIAWDMRIGTATLTPNELREILHHELDLSKSSEWLRMVRFYIQAGRFNEARSELATAISKFPELAEYANLLEQQSQELANQMFREIELKRRSGQQKTASQWLQTFPLQALPLETQLKVQDQIELLKANITQISELAKALKEDLEKLPSEDAQALAPLVEQIVNEISLDSAARLTDYARLRADASMSIDQKVALAVGGWLAGPGSGIDNMAVARSLARVSGLVTEYLSTASPSRRAEILSLLKSEEAGQPEFIGKLVAFMKPPLPLPQPNPQLPNGMFKLSVPADDLNPKPTEYLVQLPPEYDPLRKYPCVLALHGLGMPPQREIDWWCGAYDAERKTRHSGLSRYGYIVIAPAWADTDQMRYNYSEGEHSRILRCLRDCMRRTSIDTDRIFVSGHQDGAAAAWDLALAHPDLWAGAIMLSPTADKYILQYKENAQAMPTYIVWGEMEGSGFRDSLGVTVDPYLKSNRFDCIAVEYHGRPQDPFIEEQPRIIDWMELSSRRRERSPKELSFTMARPGDRFFYWLEVQDVDESQMVNPLLFQQGKRPVVEASLFPGGNGLRVSKHPGKGVVVWLRPDMFDYSKQLEIINKPGKKERVNVTFDTAVLLEDVRQRADRVAPFYQKLEVR